MKNSKGQSSIEFILTFTFGLGIFFIFLSLGFNFVSGYVAHYATFYASRVFLTQDEGKARNYFENQPLQNFFIPGKENIKFSTPGSGAIPEFYGAYFQYSKSLSIYRLLTGTAKVNYVSESYLGKEPSREECYARVCEAMGVECNKAPMDEDVTLFDNGC